MSVVYIAGPMTGKPSFNFPAFDAAEARLRAQGWDVRNPAAHDRETGFDPDDPTALEAFDLCAAFRWDIAQVLAADAIYLLEGWEASKGVAVELAVAKAIGIAVIYETAEEGAA